MGHAVGAAMTGSVLPDRQTQTQTATAAPPGAVRKGHRCCDTPWARAPGSTSVETSGPRGPCAHSAAVAVVVVVVARDELVSAVVRAAGLAAGQA